MLRSVVAVIVQSAKALIRTAILIKAIAAKAVAKTVVNHPDLSMSKTAQNQ